MKYAAIYEDSYSQDGGHGYGVYSTTYTNFISFNTETEMFIWVAKQSSYRKYKIIRYEPVEIESKLSIK